MRRLLGRITMFSGLAGLASVLSCGREPTAPGGDGAASQARRIAFSAEFPTAYQVAGGADLVPFDRVRAVLRRITGLIALDTTIAFNAATDSLPADLSVRLSPNAPPSGEPLSLMLFYVNAQGDTVFRGGPITVIATPAGQPTATVSVPVRYAGPGANAAGVRISPRSRVVYTGDPLTFSAVAVDGNGQPVPAAPIAWRSLDPAIAQLPSPGAGGGIAQKLRGSARIVAQLLTGPADTVSAQVLLRASNIAIVSGGGQQASAEHLLPAPIVARVTAADGVPVAGVTVNFSVASGGGSVGAASAVTDADGLAQTTWRLGAAAGSQTVVATFAGLVDAPLLVAARALSAAAVRLTYSAPPPPSTTATSLIAPVSVTAFDAQGEVATTFTGPVTVALDTGSTRATLLGTLTVNAVAGVAKFTDLQITSAADGYILAAHSSSVFGAATSARFTIVSGPAQKLLFAAYPIVGAVAGTAVDPIGVIAYDAFGNVASTFNAVVTLGIMGGSGAPSASLAAANGAGLPGGAASAAIAAPITTNAVNGVATFGDVRLTRSGTYSFNASADGLSAAGGPSFSLVSGPPVTLAFGSQPSNTHAGWTINPGVTVIAADAFGNPADGFNGPVNVQFSATGPGSPHLNGTTTVNMAGGIAAFTHLKVNRPGTGYHLAADAAGITSGLSAAFNVVTGPPAALSVNGGGNQVGTAGTPLASIVTVVTDSGGNSVQGASVNAAITSGGGTLASSTVLTDASGTASFSWTLGTSAGTQTIALSTPDIAGAPVTVSATAMAAGSGPPVQLFFSQQPTLAASGAAIAPAIRVQAKDASGGVTSAFTGTVSVDFAQNPGGATLGGTLSATVVAGAATFGNLSINRMATGYQLSAAAAGLPSALSDPFDVTAGPATTIALNGGNNQTATRGTALPTPISVIVTDAFGQPVSGFKVNWQTQGNANGSINVGFSYTNANGVASAIWTLGSAAGAKTVRALGASLAGSPVTFSATATP